MGDRVGLGEESCAPEHVAAGSQPSYFPLQKSAFLLLLSLFLPGHLCFVLSSHGSCFFLEFFCVSLQQFYLTLSSAHRNFLSHAIMDSRAVRIVDP